jgi:F-box and leucine-rich repeat protein 7
LGVEDVVEGCHKLRFFDVSQCKNLLPWLEAGGTRKYGGRVRFEIVSQGVKSVK